MIKIDLQEYVRRANANSWSTNSRALLQETKNLHLSVEPVKGKKGIYNLRPGSTVGAFEIDGVSLLIKPKIGIPQLLSLACYALGVYKPQDSIVSTSTKAETLPDMSGTWRLIAAARRAFARGLLRGYLTEEEALHTVRGRIRFDEQIRRRYGIPLPVELRFDEFTEDILANRLVKAAAARLRHMTLNSSEARRGLGWIAAILENVSLLEFRRRRVPEVRFDRLNEHYRHVVGLARLILLHSEFESFRGDVRASGFLIDMNVLFQEFVTQALRETLEVSANTLRAEKKVHLDVDKQVNMYPDLSWWNGETCTFVGDAKYKKVDDKSAPNSDLYQMLAYATALDLPGGILIYAKGDADAANHIVRHAGKRLEVFALDLSGSLDQILARVRTLACRIESLRAEALHLRNSKNPTATPSPAAQSASLVTQ